MDSGDVRVHVEDGDCADWFCSPDARRTPKSQREEVERETEVGATNRATSWARRARGEKAPKGEGRVERGACKFNYRTWASN